MILTDCVSNVTIITLADLLIRLFSAVNQFSSTGDSPMKLTIEPLDRHEDERGWVSEVYSGELGDALKNIHLGTMTPGAVRGNHTHPNSREWIVFHGPLIHVRWKESSEIIDAVIEEPSIVSIPENTPHAFQNESEKQISFTAYRDTKYDEENPDTKSANLL